jgi:prepilin-type N-terminal cleavage/methylation domain-containing protein
VSRRLRSAPAGERGFSLVEILVAISIFGVVAMAILPLLLASIKGGTTAKLSTQAKNVAQERLELMRNLPFHVAQQNGDYLDVLDVYFRDLADPGVVYTGDPCTARRYVAATKSYFCKLADTAVGTTIFSQEVLTTFIDAAGATVTPRTGYKSYEVNKDAPSSNLLAVRVTTKWRQAGVDKNFVLQSRIANSATNAPLISAQFKASAVKISGATSSGDVLQLEAGVLSGDGSKSTASSASATAVGAYASLASGLTAQGASATLTAPADEVLTTLPSDSAKLLGTDCALACFGDTKLKGSASAKVSSGVPQVGVDGTTSKLEAELARSGDPADRGFSYNNTDQATAAAAVGVSQLPLVSAGTGTAGPVARADGHLTAVQTGATSVTSRIAASSQAVELFPTSTASRGIVQIRLLSASLTCVDGAGRGVTGGWQAEVSVHTGAGTTGYTTYVVQPGGTQLPAPGGITTSTGFLLSHYIDTWSGLIGSFASVTQTATVGVSATIPSVVTLLTKPTRTGDSSSAINVSVGSLSCAAEDNQ